MGKAAFALGFAGSLILAAVLFSRVTQRDYTGTVVSKPASRPECPSLCVNWDQALEVVPDGFLKCACAEPHPSDPAGIVVHPPKEVADTAAPQDVLVLSYVDYTSLGGVKKSGESYDIRRGTYRQSFTITPASSVYTAIAGVSAIPAVVGIILAVLLGLIPRKKATGT